jgi:hypothetical protein
MWKFFKMSSLKELIVFSIGVPTNSSKTESRAVFAGDKDSSFDKIFCSIKTFILSNLSISLSENSDQESKFSVICASLFSSLSSSIFSFLDPLQYLKSTLKAPMLQPS